MIGRLLTVLVFLTLTLPLAAQAQESSPPLFVPRQQQSQTYQPQQQMAPPEQETPQAADPSYQPLPQAGGTGGSAGGGGTTPISQEMARKYYENCKSRPDPMKVMSEQSRDNLCSCTATRLMSAMTVEDIKIMGGNDQPARNALNKMLTAVYAPCMEFPARDLVYANCVANAQLKAAASNIEGLCGCVAGQAAQYIAANGPGIMQQELMKNPNVTDPLGPLMQSQGFTQASQAFTMQCLQQFQK